MSILTHIVQGRIDQSKEWLEGRTMTRPALIHSDGVATTYSVDVETAEEGVINENGDLGNMVLYNVPVANGNRSLIYAEIGTAVTLKRNVTGQWEVVGFSKSYPQTYTVMCVTIPQYCLSVPTEQPPGDPIYHPPILGTPYTYGQELRLLTYEELGTYGGGYGNIPYGAVGVFVNGTYTTWRTV